jgi:hypothetical protein
MAVLASYGGQYLISEISDSHSGEYEDDCRQIFTPLGPLFEFVS